MAASFSTSCFATKKYDVFISFRGEDTRRNFTSHLYSALSRYSIRTYIDNELKKGDEISPSLLQAIQDSYGSLVVFSENYASSKWCLNELLEILEWRKHGHFVIPVFYKIDPSHVRKQTASYGKAFAKHEQDSNICKEKLYKWKDALFEAANIVGWHSETNRDESELVQNIVKDILQKLDYIYQPSEFGLVGIDKSYEHIESLLQSFPVVGIWGIGGIGKTTIAKAAFNKLSSQYDSCCFLENVREESHRIGLNQLHDKLFSELLKDNIEFNPHRSMGLKYAMRRLSNRKVFIVLDDVNTFKQLEYLGQEFNFLGPNSRVVITTRDKQLLVNLRVKHVIYDVGGLGFKESLQLFKLNAFNKNYPDIGYEELSKKFVDYAKGTPLALKVLSSFLLSKSREEWESALKKLKKVPNQEIEKVLRLSFDGLDHEEQQIFLDIACLLKGEDKAKVISLLDSYGFHGAIGIRTLEDKAFVTISYLNRVKMHDLIQELGWQIVRKESIDEPGRRSRLWDSEEVYDVLKYNKGTKAVQGIILDMSQIKDLHLSADTFKRMINLRFLKFYSHDYEKSGTIHLHGNIQSFSDKLRYFHWDKYPSQSLQSTFCVEKLVVLKMPHNHFKTLWNGVQDLVNLKSLDLRHSKELIELPDFSKASNLESVDLSYCESLPYIHPSILSLQTLEILKLFYCTKLKTLKSEVHLKSLWHLDIHHCLSLKEFSLTSEEITNLFIEDTGLEILPSSIKGFNNLKFLVLQGSFKNVSIDLSELTSFRSLFVEYCDLLQTLNLHMTPGSFPFLKYLKLSFCDLLSQLPENIKYLSCLTCLEIRSCYALQHIPELPPSIVTLYVIDCPSLKTIITPSPSKSEQRTFFLTNCLELDEHSLSTIEELIYFRIKKEVLLTPFLDDDIFGQGDFLLPVNRVPSWFKYRTKQNLISIKIHPRSLLLGFVFCCVLSPKMVPDEEDLYLSQCGCYCYFEDRQFTCPSKVEELIDWENEINLMSDHVYIWYDPRNCDELLDVINEKRARDQRTKKLHFEFYVHADEDPTKRTDNAIRECGVWPVYASYNNVADLLFIIKELELESESDDIDDELEFEPDDIDDELALGNKSKRHQSEFESNDTDDELEFESDDSDDELEFESDDTDKGLALGNKSKRHWFEFESDDTDDELEFESEDIDDELEFEPNDTDKELALGNKSKRHRDELEADEHQQFPPPKKSKESTL